VDINDSNIRWVAREEGMFEIKGQSRESPFFTAQPS
jgi:hypothetical protein